MEIRVKCWDCGRRVLPAGMRSHRERGCELPKQAGQRDSWGNQRGNSTSGDKTWQEKKR